MASRDDVLDDSVVVTSARRDTGAFGDFFEDARRSLLPQLRRQFGDLADDVFQESLLIVFQRWDDVAVLDHPLAWARTVAARLAIRRRERDGRRPLLEARSQGSLPSDVDSVIDADLVRALASLRPDHAAAFRLTQVADLDVDEAASRLGVPTGTVKTWVHRARAQLATHTAGLEGTWSCEAAVTPATLERAIIERGHSVHLDAAMVCLVDRPARWQISITGGRFVLLTDDGEELDRGLLQLGAKRLTLTSIATCKFVDGVRYPVPPGSDVGRSMHDVQFDGDRMRMRLLDTELSPVNGVPDVVYREIYFDDIVYRWVGAARTGTDLAAR